MSTVAAKRDETRDLVHGVDLPALLTALGVPLVKEGGRFKAHCWSGSHADEHASVVVDAVGRNGRPPSFHCFSCGAHGDGLQIIRDRQNLTFPEAKEFLQKFLGQHPEVSLAPRQEVVAPSMATLDQIRAVSYAWGALNRLVPGGVAAAHRWLATIRHVDPTTVDRKGGAILVPGSAFAALVGQAKRERMTDLLLTAGILREKKGGIRSTWFDDTFLAVSTRRDGQLLYLWGRRIEPDRFLPRMRYVNQGVANGARWCPYGLEALGRAVRQGAPLRVVEGPITALGSESLTDGKALPTLAMLTRPGWRTEGGASASQERFWSAVIDDLKRLPDIQITPDQDSTPDKVRTGLEHAGNLAQWLRGRGAPARVVTMVDLGYQSKDFANEAERQRRAAATGDQPTGLV